MENILTSKNVTELVNCNSSDGSIVIPEGITVIDTGAFKFGTAIKSVSIPNSVTKIGVGAFFRCKLLSSVTIPDSVVEIDACAFYGCISLQKLQLSNSLKTIGYQAFYKCELLSSVTIPDSVVRIYDHAFENCSSLTSVTINKDTMIDYCAFLKCNALQLTDQIERSDIVRCRCCKEDINTRKDPCLRIAPHRNRDQYMCLDCGRKHSKNPNKYCLVCDEGNHCYNCIVKHRDGTSFPRDYALGTEWINT